MQLDDGHRPTDKEISLEGDLIAELGDLLLLNTASIPVPQQQAKDDGQQNQTQRERRDEPLYLTLQYAGDLFFRCEQKKSEATAAPAAECAAVWIDVIESVEATVCLVLTSCFRV